MPLGMIAVGFGEWDQPESELKLDGRETVERVLLRRITGILRCYDSLGKWADGELFLLLPGCTSTHAKTLAERLRDEVFALPVAVDDEEQNVKACFGVASSGGRSPLVVLREAQSALQDARVAGSGSIRCSTAYVETDPTAFQIPLLLREDLRW
jgi:hypothetical protein